MILARELPLYEVAPRPCQVIWPILSPFKSPVGFSAVLLARRMSMLEMTAPNESMRRRVDVPLAATIWVVVPFRPAGAACVLFEMVSLAAGDVVPTPTLPVFVLLMLPLPSGWVHCARTSCE